MRIFSRFKSCDAVNDSQTDRSKVTKSIFQIKEKAKTIEIDRKYKNIHFIHYIYQNQTPIRSKFANNKNASNRKLF